jgi:myo-inositol catabolism protein IolC
MDKDTKEAIDVLKESTRLLKQRVDMLDALAIQHQNVLPLLASRIGEAERRIGKLERKVG